MVEIRDDGTIMRTLLKIYSTILAFSLLFGVFFAPFPAEAGFLSSLLNNEASADATDSLNPTQGAKNSQTMALLQADIFSVPILQEKKENEINSNTNVNIVSENALLPATSRASVLGETEVGDSYSDQISVYVVRKGDSISQIAKMFGVSVNTILWANDMKKGDKLAGDDVLFILPISGIEHLITKGQTLKSIAKLYKADVLDVARFNGITEDTKLVVGDKIIIPGGEISNEDSPPVRSNQSGSAYKTPTVNVAGYFINPVPSAIRTQGLHGRNNVDLAAPIGTPVYASASGTVLLARMGWNGGFGNMVIIQHPNGTKTFYNHLSKLNSETGQNVSQGEIIAYVGNTGRVRASKGGNGSHLDFGIEGARNPGGTTPMSFASR